MAKWFGNVGYCIRTEESPGVWMDAIVEREYFGDSLKISSSWQGNSHVNDDITISTNTISIVSDPFAYENFSHIRYVTYMNSKWKVTGVEVQYPRLILTIGGLYV